MAKAVLCQIKLQIEAGKANPAPPIGSALGQRGVNIMDFCKKFNDATKNTPGLPCPTIITVYKDKTFDFVVKKPPMTFYVKKVAGISSGSKTTGRVAPVAKVKRSDVVEVVREKMPDLNCFGNVDAAVKMFIGSAKSMGVEVVE